MADMREFKRRIRFYAAKAGELGDVAAKTAARETLFNLVRATPVDQGIAISNWEVGIGSAPAEERGAYSYGSQGSTATANRTAALSAGLAQIKGYKSGEGKAIHMVNNARHIVRLNEGHSNQAPAGFIQDAIKAGRAAVRNLRIAIDPFGK